MTIDGATRLAGVIGWPVKHSLSPAMHNAAYAALGLNWCYVPLPVQPDKLGDALRGARALGLAGVNVTIPHKEAVIPYLDHLSAAAGAIGAVNTVTIEADGSLSGDNTDVFGFLAALERAGVEVAGRTALLLGAGGAARAAAYGLLTRGARVRILARTAGRAVVLAGDMRQSIPGAAIEPIAAPCPADLVVNCTPVGMWPHEAESPLPAGLALRPGMAVMDMVYRPLETRLLSQARAAGAQLISGLDMLVYQGAAAFERWVGQPAPADVMRAACLRALGEAHGL